MKTVPLSLQIAGHWLRKNTCFLIPILGFQCYRSRNVTSEQVEHHINTTENLEDHLGQ